MTHPCCANCIYSNGSLAKDAKGRRGDTTSDALGQSQTLKIRQGNCM